MFPSLGTQNGVWEILFLVPGRSEIQEVLIFNDEEDFYAVWQNICCISENMLYLSYDKQMISKHKTFNKVTQNVQYIYYTFCVLLKDFCFNFYPFNRITKHAYKILNFCMQRYNFRMSSNSNFSCMFYTWFTKLYPLNVFHL